MTEIPPLHTARHLAAGDPTGPTVVLLHGFASSGARDWPDDRWVAPLLAAERDVLVIDLPGHGFSEPVDSASSVTTGKIVAALASAVADARGGGIDLVGYSLGARLAWDLTSASPAPVRHLVLGGLSPFEPFEAVDLDAVRGFVADGTAPSDPLSGFIAQMCTAPGNDAPSLLNVVEGLASEPFRPSNGVPTVPTLVVAGTDDQMAAGGDAIAAAIPGSERVVVGGDHLGALAGDEFRSAVLRFIGIAG